jgi:hypothetical protein
MVEYSLGIAQGGNTRNGCVILSLLISKSFLLQTTGGPIDNDTIKHVFQNGAEEVLRRCRQTNYGNSHGDCYLTLYEGSTTVDIVENTKNTSIPLDHWDVANGIISSDSHWKDLVDKLTKESIDRLSCDFLFQSHCISIHKFQANGQPVYQVIDTLPKTIQGHGKGYFLKGDAAIKEFLGKYCHRESINNNHPQPVYDEHEDFSHPRYRLVAFSAFFWTTKVTTDRLKAENVSTSVHPPAIVNIQPSNNIVSNNDSDHSDQLSYSTEATPELSSVDQKSLSEQEEADLQAAIAYSIQEGNPSNKNSFIEEPTSNHQPTEDDDDAEFRAAVKKSLLEEEARQREAASYEDDLRTAIELSKREEEDMHQKEAQSEVPFKSSLQCALDEMYAAKAAAATARYEQSVEKAKVKMPELDKNYGYPHNICTAKANYFQELGPILRANRHFIVRKAHLNNDMRECKRKSPIPEEGNDFETQRLKRICRTAPSSVRYYHPFGGTRFTLAAKQHPAGSV